MTEITIADSWAIIEAGLFWLQYAAKQDRCSLVVSGSEPTVNSDSAFP